MRRITILTLGVMALFLASAALASPNPYHGVDWQAFGRHKGDLHTHTTESDGSRTPAQLIDGYKAHGFDVLAITDHDAISGGKRKTTWPWTDFGRDPEALGMIAIEGSEISRILHHIVSLYSDYASGEMAETVALNAIRDRSGLAFFAHPTYHNYSLLWYKTYFEQFAPNMLVGMEVTWNTTNDVKVWDNVLTWLMPGRPVWGFSNSDTHSEASPSKYNTFLLPELTDANVRQAIEAGRFTFSNNAQAPAIDAIDVTYNGDDIATITVVVAGDVVVRWISCGQVIHTGPTLNVATNPQASRYVRAEVRPANWNPPLRTTFTQPFAVPIKGPDDMPALFEPMKHTPAPPEAVFAEDFQAGVFDEERLVKTGPGEVDIVEESDTNHALKFTTLGGAVTEVTLKDRTFGDFTIETDMRFDEPVVQNYGSLRLRRQNAGTYYEIRFERHRDVRLRKVVDGTAATLASHQFTRTNVFMDGKVHRLKAEVVGSRIRVFFNNVEIFDHTDINPLAAGGVSLSAWSANVTFDNLWIFAAENTFTLNLQAEPADGGSVGGAGVYAQGSQAVASATPNPGYRFVEWAEDGQTVSTAASYVFIAEGESRSLVAHFEVDDSPQPDVLYVYDPFDASNPQEPGRYLLGSGLDTFANRSVGSTGEWSGQGNWTGNFAHGQYWIPRAEGLTYTTGDVELITGGGALQGQIFTGTTALTRRPFRPSDAKLTEGTVYFSFLMKWDDWGGAWSYYGLGSNTSEAADTAKLFVKADIGAVSLRFVPGSVRPSDYFLEAGKTYFFVGRVDINQTFTVWINPTLDIAEANLTPADYEHKLVSTAPAGYEGQAIWEFLMGPRTNSSHANHVFAMDEVRIGTTWASVTPTTTDDREPPAAASVLIDGEPLVGQTLTGHYVFMGEGQDFSTYLWLRADSAAGEYTPIDGATGVDYTLTQDDSGKFIAFEITPGDEHNTGDPVTSASVGPVYTLGDFNGDGVLSGLDIPGFKQALADPDGWAAANSGRPHPNVLGDFNGDGVFSGLDIPGFKQALAGF